jgi:hypothetical protein
MTSGRVLIGLILDRGSENDNKERIGKHFTD